MEAVSDVAVTLERAVNVLHRKMHGSNLPQASGQEERQAASLHSSLVSYNYSRTPITEKVMVEGVEAYGQSVGMQNIIMCVSLAPSMVSETQPGAGYTWKGRVDRPPGQRRRSRVRP